MLQNMVTEDSPIYGVIWCGVRLSLIHVANQTETLIAFRRFDIDGDGPNIDVLLFYISWI